MNNKTLIHEDTYKVHNDTSRLHSSRTILKKISILKQVRFDSSPPKVFEYEALDPENFLNDNYYHKNYNCQDIARNDSNDFFEIENHSNVYENEPCGNKNYTLTLPIPNRRELFELENYPSDLNKNYNSQTLEPLRVEDILSIDGKFIQKSTFSDSIYNFNSNPEFKLEELNDSWINLNDIKLEIDKISLNEEKLSTHLNCDVISKNNLTNNNQFKNSDLIDMQSTTDSLSFL